MPDPIDLAPFAERVDGALTEGCPMLIATANEGQPDVSLRGSIVVWDRDHLAFWERTFLESYAGLQRNPKIAAFYRSPARKEPPLRCTGKRGSSRIPRYASGSGTASSTPRRSPTGEEGRRLPHPRRPRSPGARRHPGAQLRPVI